MNIPRNESNVWNIDRIVGDSDNVFWWIVIKYEEYAMGYCKGSGRY